MSNLLSSNKAGCKQFIQYHLNLIMLAISFFTRLPVTQFTQYSPSKMRRASQYFPLVGWLIAGVLILLYYLIQPLIGLLSSLCLMMISSIMITGALHEDGLADSCDGIWGGYNRERKLSIMKDSRIGTYGTCALILVLGTKFILWWELARHNQLILALLLAYPLSRAVAISLVQDMNYVSNDIPSSGSKSEPLAKPMSSKVLIFVLITGAAACLFLPFSTMFYLFLSCFCFRFVIRHWLNKHINGYTGDALGATQQLQELLIYLILIANAPILETNL
ncbi:adenosylcobinamide-GDP ribazoletransferase [Paraglaciecola sp.]|uniref:adenosylcobinamide-GDP ribazoletransferase n=1 Tax=Paraglaciecola sp. TaxID=1920173 RepID=UPI003EF220C5